MRVHPFRIVSARFRLFAASLAAVAAVALANCMETGGAPQQPAAQKKEKAADPDAPEVPPLKEPADNEWLDLGAGFDRIILAPAAAAELGRDEIDVEPLDPRPLPLKPTQPGEKLSEKVRIVLYGQDAENDILRTRIKEIKYFEDMLLEQGYKRLIQDKLDEAFEFYDAVASRQPNWPGLPHKLVEFWFKEAESRARKLEDERAIDLLHEMKQYCARNQIPEHPETKKQMGRSLGRIVERAFDYKTYTLGRHYLFKLESDYSDHPVAKELHDRFVRDAENLRRQALEKELAGQNRDACFLIIQAADIWPTLPGIEADFKRIFLKYPILHVAARELPERFAPWTPPGSPDARVAQLLYIPLMEVAGVGVNTKFTSRILDSVESSERGTRLTLRVRPKLRWSDGEKPITATDVSLSITTRCKRELASYDPALASVVKEVRVASVNEVVVELSRNQLRTEASLLFNLAAGHRLMGDRFDPNAVVGAGPFRFLTRKVGVEANLQANKNFFAGQPKISEIVERRYSSGKDAVKAFLAGDVALLEHVPPKEFKRVEARKDDITIVKGLVPALHAISFDFRTRMELAKSRELRRAMVYAIDRKNILEGGILDGPPREGDELVNGPFPKGSYAYEPSLEAWPFDPVLAKGLVDAAKKALGVQTLQFKMQHPDTEEAREACKFIKVYWKNVGIDLELIPRPSQALEEEIALGRRFELAYRVHYVRDPVLDAARVICLGPPVAQDGQLMPNVASPWLRQNLRELEFATGWPLATEKLKVIQQQARDDVALIPLWQLADYYAYHTRLKGVVDNSLGMYQDAENWQIDPWFRTDPK